MEIEIQRNVQISIPASKRLCGSNLHLNNKILADFFIFQVALSIRACTVPVLLINLL
jgi:hypothetical protein